MKKIKESIKNDFIEKCENGENPTIEFDGGVFTLVLTKIDKKEWHFKRDNRYGDGQITLFKISEDKVESFLEEFRHCDIYIKSMWFV